MYIYIYIYIYSYKKNSGLTRKISTKRLKHIGSLLRKDQQLKHIC